MQPLANPTGLQTWENVCVSLLQKNSANPTHQSHPPYWAQALSANFCQPRGGVGGEDKASYIN